jgi:hypothetical protein
VTPTGNFIYFGLKCSNGTTKDVPLSIEDFNSGSTITGATNTTTMVVTKPNIENPVNNIPVNYITSIAPVDNIKSGEYTGIYHVDTSIEY